MMFFGLYRISFYVMLFLATLTMSVDPGEVQIAFLFPTAVAVGGLIAFFAVDRSPTGGLPRPLANLLSLIAIGLSFSEYVYDPTQLLMALAHFLVYLQLIKMFLPKTAEDDWYLFLLGLMQVLVGAFISQSDRLGFVLFCWAFMALWVLALFSLDRDATRFGRAAAPGPGGAIAADPYPGLLDVPFVVSALRVMALTLAIGGVIFLAMPRRGVASRAPRGSDPLARHLTGFDDEVQLGQLGEILENDSIVMSVELYDENGAPYRPSGEPLWRGVTMAAYEQGRWHRQKFKSASFPILRDAAGRRRTIRQKIKLEANDSPVLFGLRPMVEAKSSPRSEPELNSLDGTISRSDARVGTYDYEVTSYTDLTLPQPGESLPGKVALAGLTGISDELKARLSAIAETIVKDIPPDRVGDRARALESYFRDSGKFGYTLRMNVVDRSLDPVEDFIFNRKEGHCEYFASALTLMLRSVGIPARLVNGFKGGDFNDLAQVMNVRQKHAHSWVEAYLGVRQVGSSRRPNWLTLDPTPPTERRHSVDRVGGFTSNFRQLTDLIRYLWIFVIVGYNADRQDRLIYAPIRQLVHEARRGFRMMGQAIRPTFARVFHFQDLGQFISVRGFLVTAGSLLLLSLIVWVGIRLFRLAWRWYRGADRDPSSLSAGVVFYRRLTQLLAEYGLERPPAETQSEFARRAVVFLTGRGSTTESVADVPRLVVDAFYRVRFGHLTLSPAMLRQIETRLDALEAGLRSAQE